MKNISITIIKLYQRLISPFLGKNCRFYPTCSQYSIKALETHGFLYGILLTVRRILKCHPLSSGGIDYVPERN